MAQDSGSVHAKALAIFREMAGNRADRLSGPATDATITIGGALKKNLGYERGLDIGFHLADWGSDAAFIVLLHLFPERFTPEEILEGVLAFVIHAPNHVAAAAKLAGHPVQDIFRIGVLDG